MQASGEQGRIADGGLHSFDLGRRQTLASGPEARKGLAAGPRPSSTPDGDPVLQKAMESLRDQVRAATDIDLQLEKRDLRALKSAP